MQEKYFKYYTDLPQWAKGVVVVGGLGIVGLVGYKAFRYLFPSESQKRSALLLNTIDADISKLKLSGLKESYPNADYLTFANTIYESMRYCAGDSYKTVVSTCKKMMNDLDVALTMKAFGTRQNYCFGIDAGTPMDMLSFIQKELGREWLLFDWKIQEINRNWSSKGITYRL